VFSPSRGQRAGTTRECWLIRVQTPFESAVAQFGGRSLRWPRVRRIAWYGESRSLAGRFGPAAKTPPALGSACFQPSPPSVAVQPDQSSSSPCSPRAPWVAYARHREAAPPGVHHPVQPPEPEFWLAAMKDQLSVTSVYVAVAMFVITCPSVPAGSRPVHSGTAILRRARTVYGGIDPPCPRPGFCARRSCSASSCRGRERRCTASAERHAGVTVLRPSPVYGTDPHLGLRRWIRIRPPLRVRARSGRSGHP